MVGVRGGAGVGWGGAHLRYDAQICYKMKEEKILARHDVIQ